MTAEKMEQKLRNRNLAQTVFPPPTENDDWVVWLWAANDPGWGVAVGQGEKYEEAFREAMQAYDFEQQNAPEEVEKTDGATA